jgi:hypothetical protein
VSSSFRRDADAGCDIQERFIRRKYLNESQTVSWWQRFCQDRRGLRSFDKRSILGLVNLLGADMPVKRTTHRSTSGTKLYAVRDAKGRFKDIQTYARAHRADLAKKSTAERKTAAKKR